MNKFILTLATASLSFLPAKAQDIDLIPYPQSLHQNQGMLKLKADSFTFNVGPQWQRVRTQLENHLFSTNIHRESTNNNPFIQVKKQSGMPSEGYQLNITPQGIKVVATTEEGALWALQTLQQLYLLSEEQSKLQLPLVSITDYPEFSWRGMELDVARHFFSKEYVFKLIDLLSSYKFNKLHLHLSDDQGWRLEIKKYPKLTQNGAWRTFDKNDKAILAKTKDNPDFYLPKKHLRVRDGKTEYGGFYTQKEMKEIIAYAQSKNIEIIPEIDMPGHMSAAINNYPELLLDNVKPGWGEIFSVPINPCQESSYTFLENVLTEVMALFPSQYLHIGADEVDKTTWKESDKCKQLMLEKGFKNLNELQSYFVMRINSFIRQHGKTAIGWDEILEGPSDPNMVVMYWRGWEKNNPRKAAALGHRIIMSPNNPLYFDYQPNASSVESVYRFHVIPESVPAEDSAYFMGAQANLWTEMIPSPERVEFMILPRLTALAERVWTNKDDYDGFKNRLLAHYHLWDEEGLHYRLPDLHGFTDTQLIVDGKGTLQVKSPLKGSVVYYTMDGSLPSVKSKVLKDSVTVTQPVEVKLATISPSGAKSEIYTIHFKNANWNPALTPQNVAAGLKAKFYASYFLNTKAIKGKVLKTEILNNAALGSLNKLPSFGVKMSGFLKVPQKGIYSFFLTADDGAVLKIDNQIVVDNDGQHSALLKSGQSALEAGFHQFNLDFIEAGGGFTLRLYYSLNGSEPQPIPDEWFYHAP